MLRKSIAACCVLLFLATSAQAVIIGSATLISQPPGTPFTAPDAALPSPWESYVLRVTGIGGDGLVGGGDDETISGYTMQINTMLHQRWNDADTDDVLNKSATGAASNTRGDSHMIAFANDLVVGADEDNDASTASPGTSPLSPSNTYVPGAFTGGNAWGVGTFLKGDNGIAFANQTTFADFAQIVIPHDKVTDLATGLASITIRIAISNATGGVIGELDQCDFFVCGGTPPVPEPSSLMLGGLAMLGLVGFARRKQA